MKQDDFRHFAGSPPPQEIQLVFDFMIDDPGRDPYAPDEIALAIVRRIFRDAESTGWRLSTDGVGANVKIIQHRDHTPPAGMPERRTTARQEEQVKPALRQSMRPPSARVDLSATREAVSVPGYMIMQPPDHAAPARRLGIVLALVIAYAQILASPVAVQQSWATVGQFFKNVQGIANVIKTDGIRGTDSYRPVIENR